MAKPGRLARIVAFSSIVPVPDLGDAGRAAQLDRAIVKVHAARNKER
jgi:hypothetical protein